MICAAHAILAGAVGTLARRRRTAFVAGVGTHLIADLLPHRDFDIATETALAIAAVTAIGGAAGFHSPAFAGALGGVAPDLENGLVRAGLVKRPHFPTHTGIHGRATRGVASQALLAGALFGFIVWNTRRRNRLQAPPTAHPHAIAQ
jgi:hypothetical protein